LPCGCSFGRIIRDTCYRHTRTRVPANASRRKGKTALQRGKPQAVKGKRPVFAKPAIVYLYTNEGGQNAPFQILASIRRPLVLSVGNELLRVSRRWFLDSPPPGSCAHIGHGLHVHWKRRGRIVTRIRFYFLRAFFRASMPIFIASPSVLKYRWSSTWIVALFNSNRAPLQFLQGGNLRPLMQVTSCSLACSGSCVTV